MLQSIYMIRKKPNKPDYHRQSLVRNTSRQIGDAADDIVPFPGAEQRHVSNHGRWETNKQEWWMRERTREKRT